MLTVPAAMGFCDGVVNASPDETWFCVCERLDSSESSAVRNCVWFRLWVTRVRISYEYVPLIESMKKVNVLFAMVNA